MENIEKRLKKEIDESTPDVLDGILSSCKERKRGMTMKKQRKLLPIVALAASFALIFGAVFGVMVYNNSNAVDSVVSIDVNPSVELKLNKKEKVVSLNAVNDDGMQILKDTDVVGMTAEVAVETLLSEMTDKGYIDADKNSVLISVQNKNKESADKLSEKLLNSAYKSMGKKNGKGAVIAQTLTENEDSARRIADEYGLSYGKAKLITKIMEKDSLLTPDKLAGLHMNDLNLLIQQNGIELDEVKHKGHASDTTYITADAAKLAALAEAGLTEENVTKLKVKMDCDHKVMVYEVEFTADGIEYEYEIHATTGEILDFETEKDDDGDDHGKKPNVDTSTFITEEAALAKATEALAAIDTSAVVNSKVKLDEDDGVYVYEVTLKTAAKKYEYDIDAASGEIVSESVKNTNDGGENKGNGAQGNGAHGKPNSGFEQNSYIGEEKALETAIADSALAEADLTHKRAKLDNDDGIVVYEVTLKTATEKYEYEIDAKTGEILESEHKTVKNKTASNLYN